MVWPTVLGDYTSGDSPQWQRLTDYIRKEKVGGFTISVGSPTEVASKLNALQEMSTGSPPALASRRPSANQLS